MLPYCIPFYFGKYTKAHFRFGLSIQHVRVATTAIVATCCGLLAVIDSYTLYRMVSSIICKPK